MSTNALRGVFGEPVVRHERMISLGEGFWRHRVSVSPTSAEIRWDEPLWIWNCSEARVMVRDVNSTWNPAPLSVDWFRSID